jgi:beta-galactosidase
LDKNWRFFRGAAEGAEKATFNDSSWRIVDLPHDYSIEDLNRDGKYKPSKDEVCSGPFTSKSVGGRSVGYTVGGEAWYRKRLDIPEKWSGKRIKILFGGVYMNSDVWVNGVLLGNHPNGYTSFEYDLTDHIKFGAPNVLTVRVRNMGENSRWYSGSGIYRHVWLRVLPPVHFALWGTFVSTPKITSQSADVSIATTISNESKKPASLLLRTRLLSPKGVELGSDKASVKLNPGEKKTIVRNMSVNNPMLWDLDSPNLYLAKQEILIDGKNVDASETTFGIRSIAVSAEKGFTLNGKALLLKGGCVHHDNGCLGSAAYDRAEERKVRLLKDAGYNAVRCAHNPPSVAFLDACDKIGLLVIDEAFDCWKQGKKAQDYHLYFDEWWKRDLDSMVLRDRNHPSIIMWSVGNEIKEVHHGEYKTGKMLADRVRELDPTRFATQALNKPKLGAKLDKPFSALDICGYNYGLRMYEKDHKRLPNRVMLGTESFDKQSYENWEKVEELPYLIGDFVWTSLDYLGEAALGWGKRGKDGKKKAKDVYPWTVAYCGDLDLIGGRRPSWHYRNIFWNRGVPNVAAFVKPPKTSFPEGAPCTSWAFGDYCRSWNWKGYEGKELDVVVFCNRGEVELRLNGKSLGRKKLGAKEKYRLEWSVPYEPGVLEAVAYDKGAEVAKWTLKTAGAATELRVTPESKSLKADGMDICFVKVEVLDGKGVLVPNAANKVEFKVEGPGKLIAVGSANPRSFDSFQQSSRTAFRGRCVAIVKSTGKPGEITVTATAAGLKPGKTQVSAK